MKYSIITIITLATLLFTTVELMAQEPPTPQAVANTVSNYWINQEFTNLSSYVTNMYMSHSNYLPAILASSFHDYVFYSELGNTSNKLTKVYSCVTNSPQEYSESFTARLEQLMFNIRDMIKLYNRNNVSSAMLQSNAAPAVVRSTWGTTLLPQIEILFYTPATNAP